MDRSRLRQKPSKMRRESDMRAFMSERSSGPFAPPKDADWPTVAGHAAVTEARRILAETEPDLDTVPVRLTRVAHAFGTGRPNYHYAAAGALAEALAAFVAEGE